MADFVLADIGPGMSPHLADVRYLVEIICGVVGIARTRVVWLDGTRFDAAQFYVIRQPAIVISSLGRSSSAMTEPEAQERLEGVFRQLDRSPLGYVLVTPRRQENVRMLKKYSRRAVAWDDLDLAGRKRD